VAEFRPGAPSWDGRGTRLVTVAVTTATLVLAAACSSGGGGGSSARLSVQGRARVASRGGPERPVGGTRTLHAGDTVKLEVGSAVIRLSGDRRLDLRGGTSITLDAIGGTVRTRASLADGGDVLVTGGTDPLTLDAGDATASVIGGAARVRRAPALSVRSYTARTTVAAGGRSLSVPPLRQVTVGAGGALPDRPTALVFDSKDDWDQRFLGDAIDLGNQLVARSRGFTAQLGPTEGRSTGFYRQILPALDRETSFDVAQVGDRPPGEALVGLAIAVQGTRGSFAERVRDIFAFHDDGAAWGLVALDQGVSRAPLLQGVDEALGRQPAASAALAPPTTAPPASRRSTPSTSGSPSRTPSTIGSGPPTTPATGGTPSTRGPLNTGVPLVDNTVKALVDLLSGLLGGKPQG
jgi:hypothetical protein